MCKKETVKAYVTDFLPGEIPGFEKESLADCPVYDFNDLDTILETVLTLSKNSFLSHALTDDIGIWYNKDRK